MRLQKYILFIITGFFILGCQVSIDGAGNYNYPLGAVPVIKSTDKISWQLIHDKVLASCLDCHSGNTKPNLSTYVAMTKKLKLVLNTIDTNFMPPTDQGYKLLDQCHRDVLKKWSDQGAPDTTEILVSQIPSCQGRSISAEFTSNLILNDVGYEYNPDRLVGKITWDVINKKVLNSCQSCHGTKYNTYAGAKKRIKSILNVVSSGYMPPSGQLNSCQQWILSEWKKAGAPQVTNIDLSTNKNCDKF